jgi:hypothetical protein
MTVKIETILQFEEVQGLLEGVQGSGAVDTAELNAVVEALELDSVETDALLSLSWSSAGSSWSNAWNSRRSRRNLPVSPSPR